MEIIPLGRNQLDCPYRWHDGSRWVESVWEFLTLDYLQMFWNVRGCRVINWALWHYLSRRRPETLNICATWLNSLVTITAPHNYSLGIVSRLIGATLVLAMSRLTCTKPFCSTAFRYVFFIWRTTNLTRRIQDNLQWHTIYDAVQSLLAELIGWLSQLFTGPTISTSL